MSPHETVAFIAFAFVVFKVFGPIAGAIAHRIRGSRDSTPDDRVMVEVDELRTRLAEVEERLDFAERLMAQAQQPARLGGPTEESGR